MPAICCISLNIYMYLQFSVSNGGSSLFTTDPSSGSIYLVRRLDFDSISDKFYKITITAEDGGGSKVR